MTSIKLLTVLSVALLHGAATAEALQPRKISPADAKGPIFSSPEAKIEAHGGDRTTNVQMLESADKKVVAGIYKAGASTFKAEPYSVDEFMYFLSGSVTLTSANGKVMKIGPGDAVTIPKGWTGTWSTTGYTKYYVIYASEGMKPPE